MNLFLNELLSVFIKRVIGIIFKKIIPMTLLILVVSVKKVVSKVMEFEFI